MLLLPIIQERNTTIKNISIYISRFKFEFQSLPFFPWAVTDYTYLLLTDHTKKLKIEWL